MLGGRTRHRAPAGIEHTHVEAGRATGYRLPDTAKADDAKRRTVDIRPEQELGLPGAPTAGADVAVACDEMTGGGQQEREGKISGRLGQDARRVADGDRAGRGS